MPHLIPAFIQELTSVPARFEVLDKIVDFSTNIYGVRYAIVVAKFSSVGQKGGHDRVL
jgi:hypothetical protein